MSVLSFASRHACESNQDSEGGEVEGLKTGLEMCLETELKTGLEVFGGVWR